MLKQYLGKGVDTSEPGYAQAARVRALGPSRANPRAPRRRRVSLENEGDCSDGEEGWGGAHRLHVPPSYAAFRTALGIETDPW